jgi:hypothetical protein
MFALKGEHLNALKRKEEDKIISGGLCKGHPRTRYIFDKFYIFADVESCTWSVKSSAVSCQLSAVSCQLSSGRRFLAFLVSQVTIYHLGPGHEL